MDQNVQLPSISAGVDWNDTWRNIAAGAATVFADTKLIKAIGGTTQYQSASDGSVYVQGTSANNNGLQIGNTTISPILLLVGAAVLFFVLKD